MTVNDDALLFGSLAIAALGAALATFALTASPLLAVGLALIVFGIPSTVIVLLAAGDNP